MTLVRKSTESTSSSSSTKTLPRPVSFVKKFHKCGRESRRAAEREQQARVSAYLERNHFREINEPQQPKGSLRHFLVLAIMPHAFHIANTERAMDVVRLSSERSNSSMSIAKTLPRPVSFRKFSKMSSSESRRAAELEQQAQLQAFLRRHGLQNIDKPQTAKGCFCWRTEKMYALHHAVAENNYQMVRLLLALGADPCQKTSRGRTPAQLAKDLDRLEGTKGVLAMAGVASGASRQRV
eukprot:g863.t1